MTQVAQKLAVASVSLVLASCGAWLAYRALNPERASVQFVDNRAAISKLLDERRVDRKRAPAPSEYPPPLVRVPLDEETAALFYPAALKSESWTYDPYCYTRRSAHQTSYFRHLEEHPNWGWNHHTNDYGMREDEDVLVEAPDVRILLTGDSHMDGVCAHSESLANVLESMLQVARPGRTIESLNAGVGSFNLYNYLGMFERLKHLQPDVYIVVVYGGNDFSAAVYLQRYFEDRGPAVASGINLDRVEGRKVGTLGAQELAQEFYFSKNPEDVEVAIDLACSIAVELERQCREVGTELLFVYLPPPARAQPEFFQASVEKFFRRSQAERPELGVSDRIADPWLRFLDERGIRALDLRPGFRTSSEPLFWRTDHHLNVRGHRRAAEILFGPLEELLADRSG